METYQFQKNAIEAAYNSYKEGKGRYLVADEAGLGKTHVARGIIEKLSAENQRDPIVVIYIGSNVHLLKDTIDKLIKDTEFIDMNQRLSGKKLDNHSIKIDRLSIIGALKEMEYEFEFEGGGGEGLYIWYFR